MVYLHNGILRSREKELIPFATAWMELESIMLSEISQTVSITRDIEVKNNITMVRGEWGGYSEERGLQELL